MVDEGFEYGLDDLRQDGSSHEHDRAEPPAVGRPCAGDEPARDAKDESEWRRRLTTRPRRSSCAPVARRFASTCRRRGWPSLHEALSGVR